MARKTPTYRPVSITVWDDIRFHELSNDARLLWLFFLTSSECPIPGVLIAGESTVADRLGWPVDRVRTLFHEITVKKFSVCWEGRVLWCMNAFKHQHICGPSAMLPMATAWRNIPDVSFKHPLWCALRGACKEWSAKFRDLFEEPPRRTIVATSPVDQIALPLLSSTPSPSPYRPYPPHPPSGPQEQELDLKQESLISSSLPSEIGGGDQDLRARAAPLPRLTVVRDVAPEVRAEYEASLEKLGIRLPVKGGAN